MRDSAVEAELGAFLEEHADARDAWGRSAFAGDIDGTRPGACPGSADAGQVGRGPMFPLGAVAAVFEEDEAGGQLARVVRRILTGWRRLWRNASWLSWADHIRNVRGGEQLVVVGCDTRGRKRFLALEAGFRESKESWKALFSLRIKVWRSTKVYGCTRRRTCSTSCPNGFRAK